METAVIEHLGRPRDLSAAEGEVALLSSTGRVLVEVLRDPNATMREIAHQCGKTERAVWQLLCELERAGLLRRRKHGRRNRYEVNVPALERTLSGEATPLLALASHLTLRHQPAGPVRLPTPA